MDESVSLEQLIKDAKDILPHELFNYFWGKLRKLLREPRVLDWHAKSLEIFTMILDHENLVKKLFRYFQTGGELFSYELSFLESAHLHFSHSTFQKVLYAMLEYVCVASYKPHSRENKQFYANKILGIISKEAILHKIECLKSGIAFPFRYYEKFEFLLEMLFTLDSLKFERLLNVIHNHKSRRSISVKEFENLRKVAGELFLPNLYLTHRLLDFVTRRKLDFPRTCNPTPESGAVVSQNQPVHDFCTSESTTSNLVPAVNHVPELQTLKIQTTDSRDPVRQNPPCCEHWISENLKSDSVTQNQYSPNLWASDNQTLYSVARTGQRCSRSELRTSEDSTPSSAVMFGQSHSAVECPTKSRNLQPFSDPFSDLKKHIPFPRNYSVLTQDIKFTNPHVR